MITSNSDHGYYADNVPLRQYAADHRRRSRSPSPGPVEPQYSFSAERNNVMNHPKVNTTHAASPLLGLLVQAIL